MEGVVELTRGKAKSKSDFAVKVRQGSWVIDLIYRNFTKKVSRSYDLNPALETEVEDVLYDQNKKKLGQESQLSNMQTSRCAHYYNHHK